MDAYLARITWNRDGWQQPSGDIARGETDTYVANNGYGHEEWLNRSEWVIGGWRYAFVEGVSRSTKALRGKQIRLLLFSIKPNKHRVVIGCIDSAEVLTEHQAARANAEFEQRGWIRAITAEVLDRVGSVKKFGKSIKKPFALANIRFRTDALAIVPAGIAVPESSPFLVETLHGSRLVTQPSSSISSTSSPQSSALA